MSDVKTFEQALNNMSPTMLRRGYKNIRTKLDQRNKEIRDIRELNRQTTEDLLELRTAARKVSSTYFCDNSTRKLIEVLNRMDELL